MFICGYSNLLEQYDMLDELLRRNIAHGYTNDLRRFLPSRLPAVGIGWTGRRRRATEDLMWALLNAPEFVFED